MVLPYVDEENLWNFNHKNDPQKKLRRKIERGIEEIDKKNFCKTQIWFPFVF